ncbi:hypothetical protein N0V84_009713 [Fusarium piperis]|uniref:Zn(2)-C6 fungal-type domain-containing protein n=1 Tax=Fusarium piperis TaxID=1435070 RepID=A0A9W8W5T4_9HYPO|nr:hypothetical protein N0V84_009713 [Fusarium piperis]
MMQPAANPALSRQHRRPHRKSRNGCLNCKKRKVKCDETKPMCFNCMRFNVPCSFDPHSPPTYGPMPKALSDELEASQKSPPHRGPGRPRKDWAALSNALREAAAPGSPTSNASTTSSASPPADSEPCSLNVVDADLMLHFVHHTAGTLSKPNDSIGLFWRNNVPRIGFNHHFVLHLIYALSGFNLAYLEPAGSDSRARHRSIAAQHSEVGLRQLNEALSSITEENCGALYVAATLVSYCAFAAGPTSPNDLLVCKVGDEATLHQLPLIHGVRLIRRTVDPATLFSGLLEPLAESGPDEDVESSAHPHIDWTEPFTKLRQWLTTNASANMAIYDHAFSSLSSIYEVIYGSEKGVCKAPSANRLILDWLYRLQETFITSLKRQEPAALLILAYYTPLIATLEEGWYLESWSVHLVESIKAMLSDELFTFLEWPMAVVGKVSKIQARI